jgi:uncharacterized protein YyaL (SSP411 family)
MRNKEHTNQLISETSPYLLQHAHNPVNWHAWNDQTLKKAKEENKPIIVSIGYSACHWCHVMEHESFEDEEVANLMNDNFICIKVDREERPDVDQVYMDAIHLMGGRGGWPLNCFALPDGRPFWGGTFFPKEKWINLLEQITQIFETQRDKLEEQASEIAKGILTNEIFQPSLSPSLNMEFPDKMVELFSTRFDFQNGGTQGAPKFPMPNNYLFLLRYYSRTNKPEILQHVELTLHKMASGGIYDQIGGGFARYSVDARWHIPHFEKMLYDNAQLVSLYAEAYQLTKKDFYKQVITESLDFVKRELTNPEGGFYSSLDADTEGEEGKFYVWKKEEIESVAGSAAEIVKDYFGISRQASWEEGKNVLIKAMAYSDLAAKYGKSLDEIEKIISDCKSNLLGKRSERIRPGLDDKILTSWNALMLKAYVDAYSATSERTYLKVAELNASFLINAMKSADGGLFHSYNEGNPKIHGFLEDYAFLIEGLITIYQSTFDEKWLFEAKSLMDYTIMHFFDPDSGMFFFNSDKDKQLFARKIELIDNVIPSSNSSIAASLVKLGLLFDEEDFRNKSEQMVRKMKENLLLYPSSFSNWAILLLNQVYPFHTVVFTGPGSLKNAEQFNKEYLPGVLKAGSKTLSDIPILKNKFVENKSFIYVCIGRECRLPVETVKQAIELIGNG